MRRRDIRLLQFKNRCNGTTRPRFWLGTMPSGAQQYLNPGVEWYPINVAGEDLTRDLAQTTQGDWLAWQYEWRRKEEVTT